MLENLSDRFEIQELINHFANCFDLKDWKGLEDCFTKVIYSDYSDLRGTAPESLDSKAYVALRKAALDHLQTHHLVGNHEIELKENTGTCRASMIISRKNSETLESFATHCFYIFNPQKIEALWKISGITQKLFWNDGSAAIHKGVLDKDSR